MTPWHELSENPQAFSSLYDGPRPLRGTITHLELEPEIARLSITLRGAFFPDRPPKKWVAGANAVTLRLELFSPVSVAIERWQLAPVEIAIEAAPPGISLSVAGPYQLTARADSFRIARIEGYVRAPTS